MRKPSLRFVRNTCQGAPHWRCATEGLQWSGEPLASGLRLRWITSCVEERGLGEGAEVCDRAWGELAQRLLMQYQCNELFGRRNYNSPSSQPKPTTKTARSAVVARPGVELQSQTSMPPLRLLWGSSAVTHHLLPAQPEVPLRSPQVPTKGFTLQWGHCPTSGCVKGGMRWLSILQALADTQGRLIHPQSKHRNTCQVKTGVSLHGQGKRDAPFGASSLARSACCVLGPKGTHAPPTMPSA